MSAVFFFRAEAVAFVVLGYLDHVGALLHVVSCIAKVAGLLMEQWSMEIGMICGLLWDALALAWLSAEVPSALTTCPAFSTL